MAHRTQGIVSTFRGRLTDEPVADATLVERVRARLGRVCSHPHAIDVFAREGEVTLRGPILSEEVDHVIGSMRRVPGVCTVRNELEPHDSPEGIPSLQGRGYVAGPSLDILQRRWAPATRALVAAAAVATGLRAVNYARR